MTNNRKFIFPIGALLAVFALAAVVMIVRASADDLLQSSARLLADATEGHAVVSFEMETPEKSESGTVEVWGRKDAGPDGEPAFHVKVLESSHEEALGVEIVGDGTQVRFYRPAENTVYVGTLEELKAKMHELAEANDFQGMHGLDHDLPPYNEEDVPQTPEEAVSKLLEHFEAERAGTEIISSYSANHIRLIPIPEMMPDEFRANGGLLHLWLRVDDNAPLAAEYSDGAVGWAKITASDVQINEGVEDSDFVYEIPAGAEVVQLADLEPPALTPEEAAKLDAFEVLSPAKLPAAARLDDTVEVRGAVVQRYRLPDGGDFTVAQGVAGAGSAPENSDGELITVRGVQGMIYSDESGTRTMLTWTEGDKTIWIGGDLTEDDALEIANSLQ